MMIEDYEMDFNKAKYVGYLTNPEGARQLEMNQHPEDLVANQRYNSGKEADKLMQGIREKIAEERQGTEEEDNEGIEIG